MKTSISKSSDLKVTFLCVLGSYIVMYGLLLLFLKTFDNSTPAFLLFMVFCLFFAFKSSKTSLLNHLNFLPWPAFILIVIIFSAIIGCFTAPYHIGKWIAPKVLKKLVKNQDKSIYSEENLKKMSIEELSALNREIAHLVMPGSDEPKWKKIHGAKETFGCTTWGEARDLMDLVAKIHNEKLPQKR